MHLRQRIIQSSKHFLNAFFGIDFSSHRKFSFMSSIGWKRVPRSGNLSFGKRKKSTEAISGEYSGCSMIFGEFLARNSFTMIASWDGLSELVKQQRVSYPNNHLKLYKLIHETQKVQQLSFLNLNDDFQSPSPSL